MSEHDTIPIHELEELANVDVGAALRQMRLHYGQTLDDVEGALRIRSSQIDAIERGDISALPGRVYAIGFVRSYAQYLDVDGAKAVELFKAQYMNGVKNKNLSFPRGVSETKKPSLPLIFISFLVFVGVIAIWSTMRYRDISPREEIGDIPLALSAHVVQEVLPRTEVDLSGGVVSVDAPVVEDMGDSETQKSGIILRILKSSWVEIKGGNGDVLISKVLEEGDEYFVPDSPGLSMSLGNAGHVEILLNGRALKPLGGDGDVRRGIPLDTAYLGTLAFVENDSADENALIDNPLEDQQ